MQEKMLVSVHTRKETNPGRFCCWILFLSLFLLSSCKRETESTNTDISCYLFDKTNTVEQILSSVSNWESKKASVAFHPDKSKRKSCILLENGFSRYPKGIQSFSGAYSNVFLLRNGFFGFNSSTPCWLVDGDYNPRQTSLWSHAEFSFSPERATTLLTNPIVATAISEKVEFAPNQFESVAHICIAGNTAASELCSVFHALDDAGVDHIIQYYYVSNMIDSMPFVLSIPNIVNREE